MKKAAYLLAFVLTVFMVAESYASIQLNTLPSTKFVRLTGEPKTETKTFSGIGGPARIKLVNGDLADTTTERVSSSEIKVNGVLVFGPSDFNQNVNTLEKDINLNDLNDGSNTLSVLLKGKPGGTVSIQIIQILDNIKIDPSKILLQEQGATSQVTLTGELSNGKVVNITDPSFGTGYSSLSPGVATVSSSGLVTAVANGDTNILITNGSFAANVQVTVQITQSSRTVGQEGGTLEFHNGLVLEVPQGAVPGPTPILIKDLPLEQVTAIVTNPLLSSNRTKRFLGGFSAEPDGLVFTGPVLATIPVLPLNPREIPAQIEILLNEQRYRYVTSEFEYLRDQGVVKVMIQHFSSPGFIGLTSTEEDEEWKAKCTGCPAPGLPFPPECNIDPLQPPCCNVLPEFRNVCDQTIGCQCCREGKIEVEEVSSDFMTNECQVLGSDLKIRFVDCPGSPTEADSVGEKACKDIDLKITIDPPELTLAVNDTGTFKAFITGTWNAGPLKGEIAFKDAPIDPIWTSDAPEIADFIKQKGKPTSTIRGIKSNPYPITVWAMMSQGKDLQDVKKDALVKVTGDYIAISPLLAYLCPGEQLFFEGFLMNSNNEQLFSAVVQWSSDNPSAANCDPYPCDQGSGVWIKAGNVEDMAIVTAHSVEFNLKDAAAAVFVSSKIPKIGITSYKSGDKAFTSGANLVGTIEECGTRRVTQLTVSTKSYIGSVDVGSDGKFEIGVALEWGINHLTFSTFDQYDNRVPNNMEGVDFTLRRVPHCLKSVSTLQLPINLYGTPVTYTSLKPLIASVDPVTGLVTGHENGWAPITTEWRGYTIVRWVGVSTETNYVYTHQDDPFYEPEHVPNPAVVQMLEQGGYKTLGSDLNDKYFVGLYNYYPPECPHYFSSAGFLYDGTSVQSIFAPTGWPCGSTYVQAEAVNERGQVVGWMGISSPTIQHVGFFYDHGALSLITDPFAYGTSLADINNLGKAVGYSWSGAGSGWGFIYDIVSKTFTYIGWQPEQINDSGQVLGFSISISGYSFWIYKNGVYETVVGPSPYVHSADLLESGKVYVTFQNLQSVLLTRCAP